MLLYYQKILSIAFCLLVLPPVSVLAYIPSAEMILSRLDKNKGSGWYKISQKASIKETSGWASPYQVNETWWKGPQNLFVEVSHPQDPGFKLYFSYRRLNKTWIDPKNKRVKKFQPKAIESLFLMKKSYPSWMETVQNIKLERMAGVVNYVFKAKQKFPIFWMEQNEFVIRKVQMDKHSFVTAGKYQNLMRNLLFPKERNFLSSEYEVHLEVIHVESLRGNPQKKLIKSSYGNLAEEKKYVLQFYQNIR